MAVVTQDREPSRRYRLGNWGFGAGAMIALGVAALVLPAAAGLGVLAIIAALFALNGIAHVLHSLRMRRLRSFAWHAVIGLVYLGVGGYVWFNPGIGLASLALVIAVVFLMEGGLLLGGWWVTRRMFGSGWMAANGLLSTLLGLLLLAAWPMHSGAIIGLLLGVNLIMGGLARMVYRPVV
jgi:uncharacterized membrane protein HdeD (DUF308 family)